jgi:mannose-6-phosphate isomerase-like protein (cupin superfamily)
MSHRIVPAALLAAALAGCGSPRASYVAYPFEEPMVADLAERAGPMDQGHALQVTPLGRTEGATHHLIQLEGEEPLHRHMTHDLVVVIVSGEGVLELESGGKLQPVPFGPGHVLSIPRGVAHATRSTGGAPVLAVGVFSPPMDTMDTVPAEKP